MYRATAYGLSWVSEPPPYFSDRRGKQLYKALLAGSRRGAGV